MKTALSIIDEFDLIGVPFAWGGRDHTQTLDCYGLVKFIHEQQGTKMPEYLTPSERESKQFVAKSAQESVWKPTTDLTKEGLVIIFRTCSYLHVGYLIDSNRFVHTWEKSGGVCIEELSLWRNRIEGAYEYIGY